MNRIRDGLLFVVAACLVLLFGVLLASPAHAQLCSASLSWVAPTQNTNGTPITNLAGFRVYWGTVAGTYPNSTTLSNPAARAYIVENLTAAQWFFVTTAFNTAGAESAFSNVASKTTVGCQPLPNPRPPAGVTITVAVEVAYRALPQTNRAVLLPVGEIPADTVCDPDEGIVADGVVYFAVPRELVDWYGTVEPDIVYARCD